MSRNFQPVYSSPQDGQDITLMRILEAVSTPTSFGGFYKAVSLNTTNATVVKSSGGVLGLLAVIHIGTGSSDVRYLKMYDKATTPSQTDIPVLTFAVYAGQRGGTVISSAIQFQNGISYRMTVNYADNDNTAIAANELQVNIAYN